MKVKIVDNLMDIIDDFFEGKRGTELILISLNYAIGLQERKLIFS